ncbi:uncharacterized protein LOC118620512 isoform X1 [Molossus molossus]|uniref:uncharacterized protein LOC118620512 isoform X1 n=1 Tax=Molossus molossus TaxID=27622 RepID=UPI00174677E2|nr:uncharacterized protein LOC118620512 isoform X1 [Molossus molossus]
MILDLEGRNGTALLRDIPLCATAKYRCFITFYYAISHCSVDQDLLGLEDPIGLLGFSTAEPPWNAAATQLLDRGVNRILPLVLGESFNSILLLLFRVRRVRIFYHLEFLCLADLSPNLPVYGRQYTVTADSTEIDGTLVFVCHSEGFTHIPCYICHDVSVICSGQGQFLRLAWFLMPLSVFRNAGKTAEVK